MWFLKRTKDNCLAIREYGHVKLQATICNDFTMLPMKLSFWKWKIHSLPLQIFRMPWSSRQNCANIGQTLAAGMPFYGWYAVKHLDVTNNVDNLCVPMARVNARVATVASAPSVGMGRRSLVNRMWVGCIPYTILKCIYVYTDYSKYTSSIHHISIGAICFSWSTVCSYLHVFFCFSRSLCCLKQGGAHWQVRSTLSGRNLCIYQFQLNWWNLVAFSPSISSCSTWK